MTQQIPLFKQLGPPRTKVGIRYREFKLQCALADLIRQHINPGWKWSHLPFGEFRTAQTAAKLQRMGTARGWPDLLFISRGRVVFLELKRRGGRLSKEQAEIATHLMMSGMGYACVDNFDDAVGALQDFGILPLTIHPQ